MAKIPRILQKIFALASGVSDVEQFGSFAGGSANYTKNVALIQALAKWDNGWQSAIVGGKNPNIEDMNAAFLVVTQQLAYLFQQGIAEWDVDTTYYIGSLAMDGNTIYQSLTNNNTGNLVTDGTKWKNYIFSVGAVIWGGTSTLTSTTYAVTPSIALPNPVPEGTIINFRVDAPNNTGTYNLDVGNGQGNVIIGQSHGVIDTDEPTTLEKNQFELGDVIQLVYFNTPLNGPRWMFAGNRPTRVSSLLLPDAGTSTPAITGNTDDFAPTFSNGVIWGNNVGTLGLDVGAGTWNLTGIEATTPGHRCPLVNATGGGTVVLKAFDGGSAAGNQFFANGDVTLAPNTAVDIQYTGLNGGGWFIIGH